ncbi:aspartate aminotransferase family protein [Flexivirga sp.]|uniref:aspartate aminotransferase family protein n=1 Tax=Flexivirga sp. TaxID=1962927 RepID=UPI003F7EEAEB
MTQMTDLDPAAAQRVKDDDRNHVFHSWSAQAHIDVLPIAGGSGSYFWDYDGNRYLDFSSQLVNLNIGHGHPKVIEAIQQQAARLATIAPAMGSDVRGEAARMIAERAPGDLDRVFFTNGGADANEHAIRMARLQTGRPVILSAYRSYHGATGGAIALTGDPRRWENEATGQPVVHFFGPYPYRSAFHSDSPEQETERALQHLRDVVQLQGPGTIAAIIQESVVGTNGILVPPPGYLAGVRALCDEYGILLIADEVMAGFGRCGEWFGIQHWDVVPDLITFAKGVNSGYVPLGGVILGPRTYERFADRAYPGGLTYSGHPLGCAAAVASMQAFEDEGVLDHVRKLGETVVEPRLQELKAKHASVGDVRGLGMFWAIELVKDKKTREPLVPFNAAGEAAAPMGAFAAACKKEGLWPFIHMNRTHVVPPCTISEDELRSGLDIIDAALDVADQHAAG